MLCGRSWQDPSLRPKSSRAKTMPGRPTRTAAAKAPQILDVALDVFTVHGYQTASMDMIAAQAGMPKQTLYRPFGDKEQLFVHVVHALISRSPVRLPALVGRG